MVDQDQAPVFMLEVADTLANVQSRRHNLLLAHRGLLCRKSQINVACHDVFGLVVGLLEVFQKRLYPVGKRSSRSVFVGLLHHLCLIFRGCRQGCVQSFHNVLQTETVKLMEAAEGIAAAAEF